MTAPRMREPDAWRFSCDGHVPNHPQFPVLHYPGVLPEGPDRAARFEALFATHHWPPAWRAGIYPWHHYHATAHEASGIASGRARLRLGGAEGRDVEVVAGDVLVLPAGTAHCGLEASDDFVAVGAYPQDADVDMHRASETLPASIFTLIHNVPHPDADPVSGREGPLMRLWPRT
ncbi:cupin [Oleiagrimonas sp. MCCC 1A03011]|uniref:cupin n=1 Tax=Oleiagrimonas sp. MCCC 1A03011 TaxID=1926883 RepID=UPI000DC3A8B7|nr:cupin [Oleiagrimonas sp. MCCC 1A03011]RAP56371.1 hypothetical protein BTJ49_13230 [Oleiagrimonas sp. MCCC 1A03011]